MRVVRCLIAFLAMTTCAFGATTTLTGQATDSDGVNWSGGTYTLTFVYNPSLGTPVVNGQAFTLSYTGTLDGTGSFSQVVTSTTGTTPVTTPPASGWMVTVCPAFSSSPCYSTAPLAVTGASQSVTTQISAVIKAPRITAIGIPQAYADVEVPAAAGNQYYRVTDNTFRCYTTSWGACGGAGGGGTVTSVSVTTANGVSGTVANPTTTPAISLTLGAITPTSVAIGGGTALTTSNQTGTGSLVLANTPTLITPNIGSATGVSLNVSGALLGSNLGGGEVGITSSTTNLSAGNQIITITMAGNYSFTLGAATGGRQLCLQFIQAATGGPFTVTAPSNVKGLSPISTNASGRSMQCFVYTVAGAEWIPMDAGIKDF